MELDFPRAASPECPLFRAAQAPASSRHPPCGLEGAEGSSMVQHRDTTLLTDCLADGCVHKSPAIMTHCNTRPTVGWGQGFHFLSGEQEQ